MYSHDPAKASPSQLLVALLTVHIPKNIVVSEPKEKLVRTSRNGPKKQKVVAIRVSFQNHVLFTFGADTQEDALGWKRAIEDASKSTVAPEGILVVPSGEEEEAEASQQAGTSARKATNRQSMIPEGWRGEDDNWHVVEEREGLQVEGEKTSTQRFPVLRARAEVSGSPEEVFQLIMDDEKRPSWDVGVITSKVLKELNDQSAIVYLQTKEFWSGPMYSGPRDLVMIRYWRKDEESGDFVVTWQSVEDAKLAPVPDGFTRGRIFSMALGVSPVANNKGKSLIRISCHADPGGTLSYMPASVIQKWLTPFVTRIIGIQKALEDKKPVRLEKDAEEDDDAAATKAAPTLARGKSDGAMEKISLKLGSWNHEEWMHTPSEEPFNVRGKTYLTDKIKIPSGNHMFQIVAADLNKTKQPVPHCAARSDSPLRKIQAQYPDRQILVMQFIMPGPPFYILAVYGVSKAGVCEEDTPFSRLWNNFVEGTDEYRNTVFKLIPRVTKGAYIVKRTVGETPAILGQKVKLNYYTGPNYIEVGSLSLSHHGFYSEQY